MFLQYKNEIKNTRVFAIWKSFFLLDTYNEKNASERRRFFVSFACLFLLKSNVTKYTFHRFQQHFKLNEKCRKSDDSIDRLLDIFQSRFQEVSDRSQIKDFND